MSRKPLVVLSVSAVTTAALAAGALFVTLPANAGSTSLDVTRVRDFQRVAGGVVEDAVARCPNGMHVIGGGFSAIGHTKAMKVATSYPSNKNQAWRVVAENPGSGYGRIRAFAICTYTQ